MNKSAAFYPEILRQEGFRLIGQLNYRLQLSVWWNPAPDRLLQVLVMGIGNAALIKADKTYYLKSVSAEGETWARDINLLHTYLETHFPEHRIFCSGFRNFPPGLAEAEVRKRMALEAPTQPIPTIEEVQRLQQELASKQDDVWRTEELMSLSRMPPDLLSGHVHQQGRAQQGHIRQIETELQRKQERLGLFKHLQREYERKGSACVFSFSDSSNLQLVDEPSRFRDALQSVTNEVAIFHRYQICQKLTGGRLNIQLAEADQPVMTWIEQWLGGALSPIQLSRLCPPSEPLRQAAEKHVIITPDEPIVVDGGAVRHAEKHIAARFVSSVLNRMDKTDSGRVKGALDPDTIAPTDMPLRIGLRVDEAGHTIGPAILPLTQIVHACVSGTTGSGKSFLARVLVEEAALHEDEELSVLVLDPRNQFVGLLVPEDRPHILQRYEEFGMNPAQSRGFPFSYFASGLPYARALPDDLGSLASGRSIVSFKGLNDQQRCLLAAGILDAVFERISAQESERPRLLIVIDEAQLLTRKCVDESGKNAAAQTERVLDKIARESRKGGGVLVAISQSFKTFSHDLANFRQMMTTKIFLRNSDREISYSADILGDGRALVQLPTGTALVHNANWGVHRVRVRPPYSKVFELPEREIRQLLRHRNDFAEPITSEALKLLAIIRERACATRSPLNMSEAAELAGIASKRRLQDLIAELEQAGAIYTRKLAERGRPRVVELRNQSSQP